MKGVDRWILSEIVDRVNREEWKLNRMTDRVRTFPAPDRSQYDGMLDEQRRTVSGWRRVVLALEEPPSPQRPEPTEHVSGPAVAYRSHKTGLVYCTRCARDPYRPGVYRHLRPEDLPYGGFCWECEAGLLA